MTSIRLTAPAKVNLFLKILNKRKDGYHNILTLFERISLADKITISNIPKGIEVISDRFITRNPKDNIAYKAARLLMKDRKLKSGVRIKIRKRIPVAAGLGGGSSDAASVLAGMNRLFKLGLNERQLFGLASRLGADVPFFISDGPFAIGRSRGDVLNKINLSIRPWHLIIYPGFRLSTKDIYDAFDTLKGPEHSLKGLTKAPGDVKIRFRLKPSMNFGGMESMLHNDLQKTAVNKKKILGDIIQRLAYSLGKKVIVSGSGPSLFCLYRTRKEAVRAKRRCLRDMPGRWIKDWQIFIARTES